MSVSLDDLYKLLGQSPSLSSPSAPVGAFSEPLSSPSAPVGQFSMGEEPESPPSETPSAAPLAASLNSTAALQSLVGAPSSSSSYEDLAKGLSSGNTDLAQAQDQARQKQMGVGILSALSQGLSTATNTKSNPELYKELSNQAESPVTNLLQQRQSQGEQMKQAANKVALQQQMAEMDPNNPSAKIYKSVLQNSLDKLGMNVQLPENMAPADYERFEKILGPQLTRQIQAQANQISKAQLRESKVGGEQDKAYTNLRKDAETFRGNQEAKQAALDTYSAKKALQIVGNKDPNSLTVQDLSLLANEMAKIATGGVPGEHGVQALMPNNLQTKFAELQNFLLSKPSDANAAAYIKKNMDYLKGMVGEADKTLASFRTNIGKGYKGRVRPEDYDEFQKDYNLGPYGQKDLGASAPPAGQNLSVGPHGPTVTQNGHTYNWNPQSGKYE